MVLVLRRCLRILSVMTVLYIIPSLLWLVIIHIELINCPVLYQAHKSSFYDGLTAIYGPQANGSSSILSADTEIRLT